MTGVQLMLVLDVK